MPVRNYKTQVECNTSMDILTLRALRQILRSATDFLRDKIQRDLKNAGKWSFKADNIESLYISKSSVVSAKNSSQKIDDVDDTRKVT